MATNINTTVSIILDSSGVVVGMKDVSGQIRNLQGQFMKLKDGMKEVEKGSEDFSRASKDLSEKLKQQERTIKSVESGSKSLKGTLEGMFKPITALNQAFGVLQQSLYIVKRAFEITVGSAIELELQVARITTVLEDAEIGQVNFSKQILDMQRTFGANPTEAAQGFYEAIASGATNAAGSVDLMSTAQRLSVGGLLSVDKALSGLTSVMAAYGYEANQTKYISDGFFIAAAKGKTNVEELTMEIGNVSSIAQQANVSFEELVSAISAVTLGGKRTAEATTSVRSAINALLTPTEQLQYVYDKLGISSITAEIKQRGLQAVYEDIYKSVNYNVEALSKLVGRVEAIPGVVAVTTGKQKRAYKDMLSSITDSTKKMGETTDRAFNLIAESSSHRMEVAKGSISASLTGISQAFNVILTPIVEIGAKIISTVLRPIEKVAESFVIFSKSVSQYVLPAITMLATGIAAIKIPALTVALTALGTAFKALLVPMLAVSAKLIAIMAGIVALIAVVDSLVRNFDLLTDSFDLFVKKMTLKMNWSGLFNISGIKEDSSKIQAEMQKTRNEVTALEQKINKTKFEGGAFKGIADGIKNLFSAFEGAPKLDDLLPKIGMPELPGLSKQGEAPDIKTAIEEGKRAQEQLNAIIAETDKLEREIALSKISGNERLAEGIRLEFERVDAIAEQANAAKRLTSEQLMAIDKYKEATAKAIEIKINTDNLSKAEALIQSAASGADAVVGNAISQIGAAFGPEGKIIASIINVFRKGQEFMFNLGEELIKIIADLPLMVAEGAIGLVEGLLQGIIDMLADPARLAKIMTAFTTIAPKIITSIVKALPEVMKILLDPEFWKELAFQFVRSIFDAFLEMFGAIGEVFGIKRKKKETPEPQPQPQMGLTAQTQAVSGYQSQIFAVQNEEQAQKTANLADKIHQAFKAGVDKSASWWDKLKGWFSDNWIGVVLAPFTMGLSLLFDNEKWMQFGRFLDDNIFQPIIDFFKNNWMGLILAPFTLGLSLLFNNKEIEKYAKQLWDGITGSFKKFGNWLSEIFTLPDWAKKEPGTVEKFIGINFPFLTFAEGGTVPGKANVMGDSSKNDTVPALLSPGEVVIPRSKMQDPANARLIAAIMSGQKVGMHAEGFFGNIGAVLSGEKSVKEALSDAGEAIKEGFKSVGGVLMPDWLSDLWNSLKQYVSNIDLGKLVSNPIETIKNAIKSSMDFITDPLKNLFLNGPKFALGGMVPGSGFTDSVPAMLTPGEFVINRGAVNSLGSGLLNQLNQGRAPSNNAAPIFNISLNIETKDALDANFIRNTLVPTIKSELKTSSLRGDFVISAKGVRK